MLESKLRFIQVSNDHIQCPLCNYIRPNTARKLIYNHALKKHKIKISVKTMKTPDQIEEQIIKSRKLAYDRVKRFRQLKAKSNNSSMLNQDNIKNSNNDDNGNNIDDDNEDCDEMNLSTEMIDSGESLDDKSFYDSNHHSFMDIGTKSYNLNQHNSSHTFSANNNKFNSDHDLEIDKIEAYSDLSNVSIVIDNNKASAAVKDHDKIEAYSDLSNLSILDVNRAASDLSNLSLFYSGRENKHAFSATNDYNVNIVNQKSIAIVNTDNMKPSPKKKSKNIIVRVINKIRKNLLINNNNNNNSSSSKSPHRSCGNSVNSADMDDLMQEDIIPTPTNGISPNTSTKTILTSISINNYNNNPGVNLECINSSRQNSSNSSYLSLLYERLRSKDTV